MCFLLVVLKEQNFSGKLSIFFLVFCVYIMIVV